MINDTSPSSREKKLRGVKGCALACYIKIGGFPSFGILLAMNFSGAKASID